MLNGQVASLETEDASQRSQPSMSHASVDRIVPCCLYELWVHIKARLDVYKSLHAEGRASKAELQGVCAEAREACGYNPLTPDRDNIDSDDANRLASDS